MAAFLLLSRPNMLQVVGQQNISITLRPIKALVIISTCNSGQIAKRLASEIEARHSKKVEYYKSDFNNHHYHCNQHPSHHHYHHHHHHHQQRHSSSSSFLFPLHPCRGMGLTLGSVDRLPVV